MSRVLILGAGVYQLPLIRLARAQGHEVHVASWRADDPGMRIAHEPWVVDTTDQAELLRRARERRIEAVATTGTDVAIPALGRLCEDLGLPGPSVQTATTCANKRRMKERFAAAGVRTAPFAIARTEAEARQAAKRIGYPVMVKAPDSSGSRGVTAARDPSEFAGAWAEAARVSREGSVIVERQLLGTEFGAQLVVRDGVLAAFLPHNDTVTPPPISVPIGHSCACSMPPTVLRDAEAVCAAAAHALGIRNLACNADLIATDDGVFILELGARVGATGLPEILRLHLGLDLYAAVLAFALGQTPTFACRPGASAAILLLRAAVTGILTACDGLEAARAMPGVVGMDLDVAPGAAVRAFRTGPDRIGQVLATGGTPAEAERRCTEAAAALTWTILPAPA